MQRLLAKILIIVFTIFPISGIWSALAPEMINFSTIASCSATITCLFISLVFSVIYFTKKHVLDSMLRCFCFLGMLIVYIMYIYYEFVTISVTHNIIAMWFDLLTSMMCLIIIKDEAKKV